MNVEKASEPPNENRRPRWRVALQNFFFGSWMIAWAAVDKLHGAGQRVSWIIISGIIQGAIFAALMYVFQRPR
jgi:hypothetical protein